MTALNPITNPSKQALLDLVGKPIFINRFNEPEGYFPREAGYYFIDSVIFHFNNSIEIGVSEFDPSIPIEKINIDDSHISYYHIDDLELMQPSTSAG